MKSKPRVKNERNNEKEMHYILFSCNEWKEYSSMRLLGVTNNLKTLYVMIGSCIREGDMLYKYDNSKESWRQFQEDYHYGEINLDLLEYGYIEAFAEYSISSREFASEFPKAVSTWRALGGNTEMSDNGN